MVLGNDLTNFGKPHTFRQLFAARECVAAQIPGDMPRTICLNGGMDAGVPIAAAIRAQRLEASIKTGDKRSIAIGLLRQCASEHPDPKVAKLAPTEGSIMAVIAALEI